MLQDPLAVAAEPLEQVPPHPGAIGCPCGRSTGSAGVLGVVALVARSDARSARSVFGGPAGVRRLRERPVEHVLVQPVEHGVLQRTLVERVDADLTFGLVDRADAEQVGHEVGVGARRPGLDLSGGDGPHLRLAGCRGDAGHTGRADVAVERCEFVGRPSRSQT